jgi:hypothetical protein
MEAQEITGPGVVYTYTVNYQAWLPGLAVEVAFEPGPGGFFIPSFVAVPDGD